MIDTSIQGGGEIQGVLSLGQRCAARWWETACEHDRLGRQPQWEDGIAGGERNAVFHRGCFDADIWYLGFLKIFHITTIALTLLSRMFRGSRGGVGIGRW